MKFKFLIALIAFFTATANAGLVDRGNGMIYDDVQDITWLQDANYAMTSGYDVDGTMTWHESIKWADNLIFGGFDDWRLFRSAPNDSNCTHGDDTSGRYGYNCTANELGHMFYINFGLTESQSITDVVGSGADNLNLFKNIQSDLYWSSTVYDNFENTAWHFNTNYGNQDYTGPMDMDFLYSWAVRDGDVVSAPEPHTLAIFVLGIIGFASRRFKSK